MCTGRAGQGADRSQVPGDYQAFARALRAARAEKGYKSDLALSLAAGVHLQTLQNWMYGKTTPRSAQLLKVAKLLDKPMDYFSAIYEGREPEAQPLHETIAELTVAVRALVEELREDREGVARGKAAAAALRPPEDNGSRATPRAPRGTRG